MMREGAAADSALTGRLKAYCLQELRADLVGVANIERFAKAPRMMSPQGILPTAKSVVVMAICHPDGCVEVGGNEHPQDIGPYRVQYLMNSRLDEISYRLGLYLERLGYTAVPIVSSNIWRYKGYKELTEHFAPDLSHRHAAVAAGLADFGHSALAITPEFGARQRYVTVVTDAVLEPSPLLEPGSVCDLCEACVDECPTQALSKEVAGMSTVEIDDKVYGYANKNLWRCSWGEHFDLDVDLPIPEVVTEEVVLEQVEEHGFRGGEMGCCLRYCVPPDRRYDQPEYTTAPRRLKADPSNDEPHRGFEQQFQAIAFAAGADFAVVSTSAQLAELGIDPKAYLPDGCTAITIGLHYRTPGEARSGGDDVSLMTRYNRPEGDDPAYPARTYLLDGAAYDIARAIERRGYTAVCCTNFPEGTLQDSLESARPGWRMGTATVICNAALSPTPRSLPEPTAQDLDPATLRKRLDSLATELGADLFGVAPAARLDQTADALAPIFEGEEILVAVDKSSRFKPYEPEITVVSSQVRRPGDHLVGAQSVIVVGMRLPAGSVDRTAKPPAEAVGPYSFAQYESINLLRLLAYRAIRLLEDEGYRATLTFDLCGTGSFAGNPRGNQPDAYSNRFAAVASGLARIGRGGFPLNPELGANVRYVAIVTDAPVESNDVLDSAFAQQACDGCRRCLDNDPTKAYLDEVEVAVNGTSERFHRLDRNRANWAWRYSLHGDSGVNFLGWEMSNEAPAVVNAETLAAALKTQPAVAKYRPVNFELPVLSCPQSRVQE